MSSAQQEGHRLDGQSSLQKRLKNGMMLNVYLEPAEPIGPLLHVTGTNGRITGARAVQPKINGSTGDTGDLVVYLAGLFFCSCSLPRKTRPPFLLARVDKAMIKDTLMVLIVTVLDQTL